MGSESCYSGGTKKKLTKKEFAEIIRSDLTVRFFTFTLPQLMQLSEAIAESLQRWPNDYELIQKKYEKHLCQGCGKYYGCECAEKKPPTDSELVEMFLLVGITDAQSDYPGGSPVKESLIPEMFTEYTDEERMEVQDWLGAIHFSASDNDDVVVPPTPRFLPEWITKQFCLYAFVCSRSRRRKAGEGK